MNARDKIQSERCLEMLCIHHFTNTHESVRACLHYFSFFFAAVPEGSDAKPDWDAQVVADWQASLLVLEGQWRSAGGYDAILGFSNGAAATCVLLLLCCCCLPFLCIILPSPPTLFCNTECAQAGSTLMCVCAHAQVLVGCVCARKARRLPWPQTQVRHHGWRIRASAAGPLAA